MSNKKIIDKFKLIILNNQIIKKYVIQKNYLNLIKSYYETNLLARIRNLFDNRNVLQFINKNYSKNKNKSKFIFTSYCTATFYQKFSWDDYRITNDELNDYVTEMLTEFGHKDKSVALNEPIPDNSGDQVSENSSLNGNSWENVFKRSDLVIWRRKLIENDFNDTEKIIPDDKNEQKVAKNSSAQPFIYEYKVFGRLFDVSPLDFFRTQIDLNYRKTWDHLVVKLEVMSTDKKIENQTSELIQWIMKFPFPMNSREYIFVRRYCVNPENGLLILLSKSIPNSNIVFENDDDEDEYTESIISHNQMNEDVERKAISQESNANGAGKKKSQYEQPHQQAPYVRVTKYKSNMIIVSHTKDFHQVGLDFYLNYYDDPKARIPNMAYKWMATSGLPDWLNKLHKAAKRVPKPTTTVNIAENYEFVSIKDQNSTVTEEPLLNSVNETIETQPDETEIEKNNNTDSVEKNVSNLEVVNTSADTVESVKTIEINDISVSEETNDSSEHVQRETLTSIIDNVELESEKKIIGDNAEVKETNSKEIESKHECKPKKMKFFHQLDNEPHTSLLF